jgi:hypothetical protein
MMDEREKIKTAINNAVEQGSRASAYIQRTNTNSEDDEWGRSF